MESDSQMALSRNVMEVRQLYSLEELAVHNRFMCDVCRKEAGLQNY